jgi:hypothetical protein
MYALRGMELMDPRREKKIAQTRKWYNDSAAKLRKLKEEGKDVDAATKKTMEDEDRHKMEKMAMMQAWGRQNPGKNEFEFGGAKAF